VRDQPGRDGVEVWLSKTEPFAKFLGGDPMVKVERPLRVEFVNELLEGLLLRGGPFELEQHVVHREIITDGAPIIFQSSLGMQVTAERDTVGFVDGLSDSGASVAPDFYLRGRARDVYQQEIEKDASDDAESGESQFSGHWSPLARPKAIRLATLAL
jgi:hypothetical protein